MSKTTKKRVNKTEAELVNQLQNDKKKELIKTRMEALEKLEDELKCVFVPMINRHSTGSQTYIMPIDAPETQIIEVKKAKKETKTEDVV